MERHPPIEDYAYLSDCRSGALVSKAGSIDWLCQPRFDAPACFARIVGDHDNGHWTLSPTADNPATRRWYQDDSLVLCTEHRIGGQGDGDRGGVVRVHDFMATADDLDAPHRLVRVVEGVQGSVEMTSTLRIRFDYGNIVPWVQRTDRGVLAVGGPDALLFEADVEHHPADYSTEATFTVGAGDRVGFVLTWHRSHDEAPEHRPADRLLDETVDWWQRWADRITYEGSYAPDVRSSLIVLKGLSHRRTGGFVAAPTTSLPEWIGGTRNWDYRYCWLRDAAFTLCAMLVSGCTDEAMAWREWLIRSIAGDPGRVQIMYGLAGERRLPEQELDWLSGYADSPPVRVGNGAWDQLQLDVYGEVADSLSLARDNGLDTDDDAWNMQKAMLDWLEGNWDQPDEGIWESRGEGERHTHSQVMAWVAFDRAIRAVERHDLKGDADRWRSVAERIHRTVCDEAVNGDGVFTQRFGSNTLDASTLLIPVVGFLPPDDDRVLATIDAVQRELTTDGLVHRYSTDASDDGVGGEEGTFLVCSFWMVDALAAVGRQDEAVELYERLLSLRNDVGLLSEEYDPKAGRMLGNFPQAFSHVGIVSSGATLCAESDSPSQQRSRR